MRRRGPDPRGARDRRRTVQAAAAAVTVLEPVLKRYLAAPADGVVSVIAAEVVRTFVGSADPDGRGHRRNGSHSTCRKIISAARMEIP